MTKRTLGSASLALGLLLFVGTWSMLATAIPQGDSSVPAVAAWAAEHSVLEKLVHWLGLHAAFTAPVFIACSVLLALSTAVCSWNRTKAAMSKARTLHEAESVSRHSIATKHDLEVKLSPSLGGSEGLAATSEVLARLGIKTKEDEGVVRAVSRPWSVWGSPVFHWSLVALILAVFIGLLVRSEGSMGIAVGDTKADKPSSYVSVKAGRWHNWSAVRRSIRVDSLDPDYKTEGIDRGAVPTVSVLDQSGKVLVTQPVYANMKLHSGSLSISAPAVGLAVRLAIIGLQGNELGTVVQLVDFAQSAPGGTRPLQSMMLRSKTGQTLLRLYATVPLDRASNGGYGEWIPKQPAAQVHLVDGKGDVLLDAVVREGTQASVPGVGAVRVESIGWYSRLALVDDPTIPVIYGAMIMAILGLTLSVAARQRLLVATVVEGADGASVLAMRLRLWRNNPTSRGEIESELAKAIGRGRERTGS